MSHTQTRVVGSGFTTFNYRGQPIAFLESFNDSGQKPISQPQPITPLGSRHPVEIATGRVLGPGTLRVTIRELWNGPVWKQLMGLSNANNIVDVFEAIAADTSAVTCQMIIKSPTGIKRGKVYHGCVITEIDDTESVSIDSMTVPRSLTIMYTHTTPTK